MTSKGDNKDARSHIFSNNFWGKNEAGHEALMTRMRQAKQTCDEVKSFLHDRASIEEDYGKRLMKLSKTIFGKDETGSLRESFETTRQALEATAKSHINLAQNIKAKLEQELATFIASQKEKRKQQTLIVDRSLRNKQTQTANLQKAKEKYETECVKMNALLASRQNSIGKDLDKFNFKLEKSQIALRIADQEYQNYLKGASDLTQKWNLDWRVTCDKFQDLEEERIDFLKRNLWLYANLISSSCVADDESCESIRSCLEQCHVEIDILTFIRERATGPEIPEPPSYVNFQSGAKESDLRYTLASFERNSTNDEFGLDSNRAVPIDIADNTSEYSQTNDLSISINQDELQSTPYQDNHKQRYDPYTKSGYTSPTQQSLYEITTKDDDSASHQSPDLDMKRASLYSTLTSPKPASLTQNSSPSLNRSQQIEFEEEFEPPIVGAKQFMSIGNNVFEIQDTSVKNDKIDEQQYLIEKALAGFESQSANSDIKESPLNLSLDPNVKSNQEQSNLESKDISRIQTHLIEKPQPPIPLESNLYKIETDQPHSHKSNTNINNLFSDQSQIDSRTFNSHLSSKLQSTDHTPSSQTSSQSQILATSKPSSTFLNPQQRPHQPNPQQYQYQPPQHQQYQQIRSQAHPYQQQQLPNSQQPPYGAIAGQPFDPSHIVNGPGDARRQPSADFGPRSSQQMEIQTMISNRSRSPQIPPATINQGPGDLRRLSMTSQLPISNQFQPNQQPSLKNELRQSPHQIESTGEPSSVTSSIRQSPSPSPRRNSSTPIPSPKLKTSPSQGVTRTDTINTSSSTNSSNKSLGITMDAYGRVTQDTLAEKYLKNDGRLPPESAKFQITATPTIISDSNFASRPQSEYSSVTPFQQPRPNSSVNSTINGDQNNRHKYVPSSAYQPSPLQGRPSLRTNNVNTYDFSRQNPNIHPNYRGGSQPGPYQQQISRSNIQRSNTINTAISTPYTYGPDVDGLPSSYQPPRDSGPSNYGRPELTPVIQPQQLRPQYQNPNFHQAPRGPALGFQPHQQRQPSSLSRNATLPPNAVYGGNPNHSHPGPSVTQGPSSYNNNNNNNSSWNRPPPHNQQSSPRLPAGIVPGPNGPSNRPGTQLTDDGRPILFTVRTLYDYRATIPEEISFTANDVLAVLAMQEDGWWEGELLDESRKVRGLFPSNFTTPLD
ncbi:hypothetical protein G9A89_009374 [Geosiphon pyriformis]|nr:hypothetical protein G9A89_009374 [Geosiphon pyriformis]